jgi:hypothetical protein
MRIHKPIPRALHACLALAFPILMTACGGGGGDPPTSIEPPAPPPVVIPDLTNFPTAEFAIGQANLEDSQPNRGLGRPDAHTLFGPGALALTPGGGLLVADSSNNRVLFFETMPAASGAMATTALGQPGLQSSGADVSRTGMSGPQGVTVGDGKMAVVDKLAHRVLIYNEILVSGAPAPIPAVVIGQPDFDTTGSACGAGGLSSPSAAMITSQGQLIVADTVNHRVLIWDSVPEDQVQAASPDRVLGQASVDECFENGGATPSGETFSLPSDLWSDGRRLVVADSGNHRVLIWNQFPTADGQSAEVVLGHSDFFNVNPNNEVSPFDPGTPSNSTFHSPGGVHSDGTRLAVTDSGNNRVLIWDNFPSVNLQAAGFVIGHLNFNQKVTDGPKAQTLSAPSRALLTADSVIVSDTNRNRVLVYRRK